MRIDHCRVCRGSALRRFLDLGSTALANRFLSPERAGEAEPLYPLRVVFCDDCGLVQIDEEVAPEELFKEYIYFSGTSDLVHSHAAFLARHFTRVCPLAPGDLVLEIASNDGTVLQAFQPHGFRTVGVEPAANVAAEAVRRGVETHVAFFNADGAEEVRERWGPARLVLARHVLAHVADLHGFVRGLRRAVADDGVVAVECPHLLPFHANLEYDTVYHEHLCYFSVRVLLTLFRRFDLEVVDVLEVGIHGGSVVVSAQPAGGPRQPTAAVADVLRREEQAGLHRAEAWEDFAGRAARSKASLCEELDRLAAAGRSVAGYGAPAKGMTLLSYCGLGPRQIPYLVDRSPHKQGLLTPGCHIPVRPPEVLLRDRPDILLILAWNFADEIVRQQGEYARRGGRFLLPIPSAHYRGAGPAFLPAGEAA